MEGIVSDVYEPYNLPRQELPSMYFQSGDIEVVRRDTIIGGSMSGNSVFPLVIEQNEMLDIDDFSDLNFAENNLKKFKYFVK